ncbi:MAG: helix-turn-helix domain-containing protein [Brevundimonas sp.]
MSFQAMAAVRTVRDISPTARLVLFVLAQFAGADGLCHPSQQTIADEAGLSERAVRNGLKELREAGVITTARRCRRNGSRTSDQIELMFYAAREEREDDVRLTKPGKSNRQDVPVHTESDNRQDVPEAYRQITSSLPAAGAAPTTFESVREYPEQETIVSRSERECGDDGFDDGLAAYPASGRGVTNEGEARTAWAAAVVDAGGAGRLTAAVRAYAVDPSLKRRDFGAPSFQRWLGENRWRTWLRAEGDAPVVVSVWSGPEDVEAAVADAIGAAGVASYLRTAGWDGERRIVRAATSIAGQRLRDGAGSALKAIGVKVEIVAAGSARHG